MIIKDGILYGIEDNDILKGHLAIPDGVHTIAKEALKNHEDLVSVTFPESLKKIEDNAFYNCTFLKKVQLPANVTEIGNGAFHSCKSLSSLTLNQNLKSIGEYAFSDCHSIKKLAIPDSVEEIKESAFAKCIELKKVQLPSSLKTLSPFVFDCCVELKKITMPNSITTIDSNAFNNCYELRKVRLPENLEVIADNAFANCKNIIIPAFPETLREIGNSSFYNCYNIKNLNFTNNLQKIGKSAFYHCTSIRNVDIPSSVKIVDDNAFEECPFIKSLTIGDGVETIGVSAFENTDIRTLRIPSSVKNIREKAFYNCSSLGDLYIEDGLETIEPQVFSSCGILSSVRLPKTLKKIEESAFADSPRIGKINIPVGVTEIGNSAFIGCHELEELSIPNTVKTIGESAFQECRELREVTIPRSVEQIKDMAFTDCSNLQSVTLKKGLKSIGNKAFSGCEELSDLTLPEGLESMGEFVFEDAVMPVITIPKSIKSLGRLKSTPYSFFCKTDDGFVLSHTNLDDLPMEKVNIDMSLVLSNWDKSEDLFREQKNPIIAEFYNNYIATLPKDKANEFIENHNFTFLKQYASKYKILTESVCRALYNLGCVSAPFEKDGKTYNYAQKSTGFILEEFRKKNMDITTLSSIGVEMEDKGFNKEFADFFIEHYDELAKENEIDDGFIAKCYNNFETVQKTNTNNHGSQRQLKATVQKFKDYFNENKFNNVTEKNRPIAETISPYYTSQDTFDLAVDVMTEKEEAHVPDHILSIPLKEENAFAGINGYAEKIVEMQAQTLGNLVETANNEFTFEWLAKNDPTNLILGKLCSCCAHLEGAGYGVAHASIIHPNVQTMVIRDKTGEIIAKSTIYINPEERYGVVNSVQINDSVDQKYHPAIYQKFIKGVTAFAEQYNKEHPYKELTQINIGMANNALTDEIVSHNRKSTTILQPINYNKFDNRMEKSHYAGDSFYEQYVIWKPDQKHTLKNADSDLPQNN